MQRSSADFGAGTSRGAVARASCSPWRSSRSSTLRSSVSAAGGDRFSSALLSNLEVLNGIRYTGFNFRHSGIVIHCYYVRSSSFEYTRVDLAQSAMSWLSEVAFSNNVQSESEGKEATVQSHCRTRNSSRTYSVWRSICFNRFLNC